MKNQQFTPKADFWPFLLKKDMAKTLKNPRYSGKTIRDTDGTILRGPGFYHD